MNYVASNRDPPKGNTGVTWSDHPFATINLADHPFRYSALHSHQSRTQHRRGRDTRYITLKRLTSLCGVPLAGYITDGRTNVSLHPFASDAMYSNASSNGHHSSIGKEKVEALLDERFRII